MIIQDISISATSNSDKGGDSFIPSAETTHSIKNQHFPASDKLTAAQNIDGNCISRFKNCLSPIQSAASNPLYRDKYEENRLKLNSNGFEVQQHIYVNEVDGNDQPNQMSFKNRCKILQEQSHNNPQNEIKMNFKIQNNSSIMESEPSLIKPNQIPQKISPQEANSLLNITLDLNFELNKINTEECDDESFSPTMKLRKVILNEADLMEQRICKWLDAQGIIQVDPSQKREDYYKEKRANLLQTTGNKNIQENRQGGLLLSLNKVQNSPLLNRRKQVTIPVKKHMQEIISEEENYPLENEQKHKLDNNSISKQSDIEESSNKYVSQLKEQENKDCKTNVMCSLSHDFNKRQRSFKLNSAKKSHHKETN